MEGVDLENHAISKILLDYLSVLTIRQKSINFIDFSIQQLSQSMKNLLMNFTCHFPQLIHIHDFQIKFCPIYNDSNILLSPNLILKLFCLLECDIKYALNEDKSQDCLNKLALAHSRDIGGGGNPKVNYCFHKHRHLLPLTVPPH